MFKFLWTTREVVLQILFPALNPVLLHGSIWFLLLFHCSQILCRYWVMGHSRITIVMSVNGCLNIWTWNGLVLYSAQAHCLQFSLSWNRVIRRRVMLCLQSNIYRQVRHVYWTMWLFVRVFSPTTLVAEVKLICNSCCLVCIFHFLLMCNIKSIFEFQHNTSYSFLLGCKPRSVWHEAA